MVVLERLGGLNIQKKSPTLALSHFFTFYMVALIPKKDQFRHDVITKKTNNKRRF